MKRLRVLVWTLFDPGGEKGVAKDVLNVALIALILINAAAVSLETLPSIALEWSPEFAVFEAVSILIFTAEYLLRLWTAPEDPRHALVGPWRARWRFATSPLGIVDLLAVLPFFLADLLPADLRFLRLLRLLRILKLGRYSPALGMMGTVLRNERTAVVGALCVLAVLVVLSSAIMYRLEHAAQPEAFASIPHAMWWAMSTLTTVGYGDVTPVTPAGRILGALVMLLGIGVFVLWTSIFAAGFIAEARKRNFVVTWKLVEQVPVFSGLDVDRIADIGQLLKPEVLPARFTVIRRGEVPTAMFFVVSGELEIDLPTQILHVHEGQSFGETALLESSARQATVTTLTECHLLRLDRSDFEGLMEAEPDLRAAILQASRERAGSVESSEI
ncbi:MAG: ion transporter [Rhodospirillaceae bacterium]